MTRRAALLLILLTLSACATAPARETAARRSPLVVVLVVDQMRALYLEEYGGRFTSGLKRLRDEGTDLGEAERLVVLIGVDLTQPGINLRQANVELVGLHLQFHEVLLELHNRKL